LDIVAFVLGIVGVSIGLFYSGITWKTSVDKDIQQLQRELKEVKASCNEWKATPSQPFTAGLTAPTEIPNTFSSTADQAKADVDMQLNHQSVHGIVQQMPISNEKKGKAKSTSYNKAYTNMHKEPVCEVNLAVFGKQFKHKAMFAKITSNKLGQPRYTCWCLVVGSINNKNKINGSTIPLLVSQYTAEHNLNVGKGNLLAEVELVEPSSLETNKEAMDIYNKYYPEN
jgi:hypothetical protein